MKSNCTIPSGVKVEAGEVIFSTRRKIDGVDNRNLEDAVYAFGFGPKCSYENHTVQDILMKHMQFTCREKKEMNHPTFSRE